MIYLFIFTSFIRRQMFPFGCKTLYPWQRFAPHATAIGSRKEEIDGWWRSVAPAVSLHGKAASRR